MCRCRGYDCQTLSLPEDLIVLLLTHHLAELALRLLPPGAEISSGMLVPAVMAVDSLWLTESGHPTRDSTIDSSMTRMLCCFAAWLTLSLDMTTPRRSAQSCIPKISPHGAHTASVKMTSRACCCARRIVCPPDRSSNRLLLLMGCARRSHLMILRVSCAVIGFDLNADAAPPKAPNLRSLNVPLDLRLRSFQHPTNLPTHL